MAAHHASRHARIAEVVDAARGAIALPGGVNQRQIARLAGCQETTFQRMRDGLGVAGADKPRARDRPPRLHQPGGFVGCDDLHVSSVLVCCVDVGGANTAPRAR